MKDLLQTVAQFALVAISIVVGSEVVCGQMIESSPEISLLDQAELPVPRFRKQFFQGIEVAGGGLWDFGDTAGAVHQTFGEVGLDFGVPLDRLGLTLGGRPNLLGLRPSIRVDSISGPTSIDVPATLYDTGLAIFNRVQWSERISSIVIVTPSVRSDLTTSNDAFRLFGLGLMNWQWNPQWSWSAGALYLDRADLPLIPVIAATWTPTPRWRIEATMPKPRIAHRLWKRGREAEAWAYIGAGLGGNTWSVSRDAGGTDELTLRDIRLLAGYEVIRAGNRGIFIEGGLALGRQIQYERQDIEVDLDNAAFIEAGIRF